MAQGTAWSSRSEAVSTARKLAEPISATDERRRTLGAAIRRARGNRTQVEVASALGVGQPAISGWESGKVALDLDKVHALERALNLVPGALARAGGYVARVPE